MDITQALKDTENTLRDFIFITLSNRFGLDWVDKCGVTPGRIQKWQARKEDEARLQMAGVVEERILYYADFYDIKTILTKHWEKDFKAVFGDLKTMDVWLTELENLRNPDAHRRELLPHQKHLAIGIAGEIRTRLIKYRSKMEEGEDYYPRIESARDNLGNIFTYGITGSSDRTQTLRPGDKIDFVITASDPMGDDLEYGITLSLPNAGPGASGCPKNWQKTNEFSVIIENEHVRKGFGIMFWIKSPREYHAHTNYDDAVAFYYDVLPPVIHQA